MKGSIICLWLSSLVSHTCGFKMSKTSSLKMMNNDYLQDVSILHKYKSFFIKENYNNVMESLMNHRVSNVLVDTNYKQLVYVDNLPSVDGLYNNYHISDINPMVVPNLVEKTSDMQVPIHFVNFTPDNIVAVQNALNDLWTITSYAIPVMIILSLISTFANIQSIQNNTPLNMKNRKIGKDVKPKKNLFGGMMPRMGNNQKEETENKIQNITLDSWAGSPEVIEECKEVISYIENKEKYSLIGAEMPKGILLEGPPGTGKTLLAKAIASETNSTFITMSGSEFVELFVGMGASRVRDLFDNARENKPSIIFIDEIDAVGRQRGAGINMANDEREQTLNQLLYEMDGFNNNDDVVVIAATNRKDVLDQALLRPGRFDRIILVPLPDKDSRMKILGYYLKNKRLEKEFDVSSIAELTDGFSGAQLKNLINEASILSVRNNYTTIQEKYVFDAFEKLVVGLIKQNATVAPSTKLRVAIHESGHSLLTLYYSKYFEFKKASIQPTYNGAGGYTMFSERIEYKDGLYTKDLLKKRLVVSMGGKAAESIYYGNDHVSLGAIQDLKQANGLAKRMIGNFGMGDRLEVFYNEDVADDSNPFLGRSLALGDKYSEHTRLIMDRETLQLVKEAYQTAKDILEKNRDKLIEFSNLLQNNTVVYANDVVLSTYSDLQS